MTVLRAIITFFGLLFALISLSGIAQCSFTACRPALNSGSSQLQQSTLLYFVYITIVCYISEVFLHICACRLSLDSRCAYNVCIQTMQLYRKSIPSPCVVQQKPATTSTAHRDFIVARLFWSDYF